MTLTLVDEFVRLADTDPRIFALVDQSLVIQIGQNDAAICVDGQNDFADPNGALYVRRAGEILKLGAEFLQRFRLRYLTGDCHDPDHCSYKQWPVHCVKNTWGAEQHPILASVKVRKTVLKGWDREVESYGAVEDALGRSNGLSEDLREQGCQRTFVFMLAFDYCVGETAEQLAKKGFEVYVVVDLTREIGGKSVDDMIERLVKARVKFIFSSQVH